MIECIKSVKTLDTNASVIQHNRMTLWCNIRGFVVLNDKCYTEGRISYTYIFNRQLVGHLYSYDLEQ